MDKDTISAVMKEMGRRGGRIGGKKSLDTMTPEERTARAKKASDAAAKARTAKAAAKRAGSKVLPGDAQTRSKRQPPTPR